MLLQNKTAIVYGAAGPVGAAVAGAFAREGARVVLAGRTQQTLAKVAEQIRDAGGNAATRSPRRCSSGAGLATPTSPTPPCSPPQTGPPP